jgi:hypothetical protein
MPATTKEATNSQKKNCSWIHNDVDKSESSQLDSQNTTLRNPKTRNMISAAKAKVYLLGSCLGIKIKIFHQQNNFQATSSN